MTLAEEIARKHGLWHRILWHRVNPDDAIAALNEMAERIFEQTRERAAQIADHIEIISKKGMLSGRLIGNAIREMTFEDIAGSESAK